MLYVNRQYPRLSSPRTDTRCRPCPWPGSPAIGSSSPSAPWPLRRATRPRGSCRYRSAASGADQKARSPAVGEQLEALLHRQQEVHRAQAEDRKDVGGQHDERVGGDREDCRDRVHREDQVDDADHRHHYQQRGGHLHTAVHGKKSSPS